MAEEQNDQGEQPALTEDEIKTIREMIAHRIYGNGKPRCSVCGSDLLIPNGTCGVCQTCGSQIGGC